MSRIRTIKPELFRHEELFEAERVSHLPLRLAFIGLLTCCDREGRFKWQPRQLKLDILPYDEIIDFSSILDVLAKYRFILHYEVHQQQYGCIPSWHKHQCVNNKEKASQLPPPEEGILLNHDTTAREYTGYSNEKKNGYQSDVNNACMMREAPVVNATCTSASTVLDYPHSVATQDKIDDIFVSASNQTNSTLSDIQESHVSTCNPSFTEMSTTCEARVDDALPMDLLPTLESLRHFTGEGEREGNKEEEGEKKKNIVAPARPLSTDDPVECVFTHWKTVMQHPHAKLDPSRRSLIRKALQSGYTVEALCEAITGCSLTPHNRGENDRHQRYDGLHIILRNGDQIDRFRYNAQYPPQVLNRAEQFTQTNVNTIRSWLMKKSNAGGSSA